jgi:hypothetical protein
MRASLCRRSPRRHSPPAGAGVKLFETPGSTATLVSDCTMNRPTSMSFDRRSGTLYVTELLQGTVVKVPLTEDAEG